MNYIRKRLILESINKKIKEQNVISFLFFYLEQDIKKIHFFYWLSNVLFHGLDRVLPIKQVRFLGFRCLIVKDFFFFNTKIYNKLWFFFFAGFLLFRGFPKGVQPLRGKNYTTKTENFSHFGVTSNKNIFISRNTLTIFFNKLTRFYFLYQKNQQKKKTEISYNIKINKNVFFVHLMLQKKCKKTAFFPKSAPSLEEAKSKKKVSLIPIWGNNPVFFNKRGFTKSPFFFCFAKKPLRHSTNLSSMYISFLYLCFYFFILKNKNTNIKKRGGIWKNRLEVKRILDLIVKKGTKKKTRGSLFLRCNKNVVAVCDFFSVTKKIIKKTFLFFVLGMKKKKERDFSRKFLGHDFNVSNIVFLDFDIGWKITFFKKNKKTSITVFLFLHRLLFIVQVLDISNLINCDIIQKKRH